MKKLFTCGMSLLAVLAVAACGEKPGTDQPNPDNGGEGIEKDETGWYVNSALEGSAVNLNIAVNDGGLRITNTGTTFEGLDGAIYDEGALLPNWKYMEKRLNIKFTDTASGSSRSDNWTTHSAAAFKDADLINGSTSDINKLGAEGKILDLMEYVDVENPANSKLPNISRFIASNSVLAKTMMNNGKLYYPAYFDGFAEPEHFFHMNQTMVKNILDSAEGAGSEAATAPMSYTGYNNYTKDANVEITVGLGNDAETQTITKKNTGKNAISAISTASTGKAMIAALKNHLNTVYAGLIGNGNVYENLSDIFISERASYDTDEMLALMYCIHNNEALAQGVAEGSQTTIDLMVTREYKTGKSNQRAISMIQAMSNMFGVRGGMISKCNGAIYVTKDGEINDGRATAEFEKLFDYTSALFNDGIIPGTYETDNGIGKVKTNQAFSIHDYMNNSTNNKNTGIYENGALTGNVDFQAVLPPVNNWDDGDSSTDYFHFAESNRSGAKTESWCIPERVKQDPAKLDAALLLIDYIYSIEGDMLFNYGPNAEQVALYGGSNVNGYCKAEKVYTMSNLRGCMVEHYNMSDEALYAMNNKPAEGDKARSKNWGNGWNTWSKAETGANLPIGFIREFFAEQETMSKNGNAGYAKVSTAFSVTKTYKTLQLDPNKFYGKDNMDFFKAVPSIPLSTDANQIATNLTNVTSVFSNQQDNAGNVSYVKYGWGSNGNMSLEQYKGYVQSDLLGTNGLIALYQQAYNNINK